MIKDWKEECSSREEKIIQKYKESCEWYYENSTTEPHAPKRNDEQSNQKRNEDTARNMLEYELSEIRIIF